VTACSSGFSFLFSSDTLLTKCRRATIHWAFPGSPPWSALSVVKLASAPVESPSPKDSNSLAKSSGILIPRVSDLKAATRPSSLFPISFALTGSKCFSVSLVNVSSRLSAFRESAEGSEVVAFADGAVDDEGVIIIADGGGGSKEGGGLAPASWRLGGAVGSVPDGNEAAAVLEDGNPIRRVSRLPVPGWAEPGL